jgi:hypothetical protein
VANSKSAGRRRLVFMPPEMTEGARPLPSGKFFPNGMTALPMHGCE